MYHSFKYQLGNELTDTVRGKKEKHFVLQLLRSLGIHSDFNVRMSEDRSRGTRLRSLYIVPSVPHSTRQGLFSELTIAGTYFLIAYGRKKQLQYRGANNYVRISTHNYTKGRVGCCFLLDNLHPVEWLPTDLTPIDIVLQDRRIPWKKLGLKPQ